jgi:hypothetical protein
VPKEKNQWKIQSNVEKYLCQKRKTSGKFSQMSKKHPHFRKIRNKYLGFYISKKKKEK